ncbi:MAG: hypothetical protein JWO38_4842 [Gemmataceae bacterium]|nr:hypothetical protein [Gemmataceae bacterium]
MAQVVQELVHRLGRIAACGGLARLTDVELLLRFATDRDPTAFEVLVWRHGAMVLDVCGRVLGRGADADDAFQATFLALVRHARSIRAGESLAGWLYRVARRISIRVSRQKLRRARRECLAARLEAVIVDDVERSDWRAFLDREIERLPPRYREAFILCHLEGRAHETAARELGCPLGTLHSRLARAKERLRARLGPYGVALPAVAAVAVSGRLVKATVTAAVGLAEGSGAATSTAAAALSQGVWNPMVLIKAKCFVAAVLAVAAFGAGATVLKHPAATATSTPATPVCTEPTVEELKRENERLRREVASLKKRLAEAEGETARRRDDDPPTDAEVLRALPKVARGIPHGSETFRDDVVIVKNRLVDKIDPPRYFPLVGLAQLRHCHWECVVHYTETVQTDLPSPTKIKKQRSQVVYIDKDTLVRAADRAK